MKTSYSKTWTNHTINIPKKQNWTAKFTALAGLLIIGLIMVAGAASADPAISKTALGKIMDKNMNYSTAVLNESITFTIVVTGDGATNIPNLVIHDVFPVTNGSISGWKYTGTKSCKYKNDSLDPSAIEVDCLNNVKQGNETIFSSYNTTVSVNWTIPSLAPTSNLTLTYTAMPTIYADKDTSWTTPVNCNNASLVGYSATDSACVLYILSRVELNKTITLQPNNLSLVTIWLRGVGGEGNTGPIAAENYSLQDISLSPDLT